MEAAPRPQQADFTARVDAVRVDVDVRRGNKPVTGLRASDFEVLDNGVPQRVELVSPTALPLNVVLALDGSTSLDARERAHLVAAGKRVIDALRPTETAALVTFSDRVAIQSTFTDDWMRLRMLVGGAMPGGDTALHDAAHVAMVLASSAPGRSMVILFSDGDDTASVLTEDSVLDTAKRTGAVVCVVTLGTEDAGAAPAGRAHRRRLREGVVAGARRRALRRDPRELPQPLHGQLLPHGRGARGLAHADGAGEERRRRPRPIPATGRRRPPGPDDR